MGERVILSNDPIPIEIGIVRTIGTKKRSAFVDFNEGEFYEWGSSDEDDARIAEFLENHRPKNFPQKRVCIYYQSDSCRNGNNCTFAHEYSEDAPQ